MSEEVLAEDSIGATEAESSEQDAVENDAGNEQEQLESDAETNDADHDGLEEEAYEIGDLQATESEIKSWREAYKTKQSKDKDYTQKTQALSEQRKALEEKQYALEESLEFFNSLSSEIDDLVMGDLKNVDLAELIEVDPAQYERTKQKLASVNQWKTEFREKLNQKTGQVIEEAKKQLYQEMGWIGDEAKFNEDAKAIHSQAKAEGATPDGFSKVTQPWVMKALLKANKYDQLMAKKTAVTKQVRAAPRVTKPSKSSAAPKTLAQRMYPNMK